MSDEAPKAEFSQLDIALGVIRTADSLEAAAEYFKDNYKLADLASMAVAAGVTSPATTKGPLVTQLIAALTSHEQANIEEDEATSDQGVLSEEERVEGVSLPAKVASYHRDQLWPQILSWELDQGLAEDARSAYTEAQLREYLAYLFNCAALAVHPREWAKITDYEFRGIRAGD